MCIRDSTSPDSTTVGIKVSPCIRDMLVSKGRIYVGNTSCRVLDRFDVRQCFKCQRFGHMATQCRASDPVCMYCSASHLTKNCPHKYNTASHRCVNCSHSSNTSLLESCDTHHSGSDLCPVILSEKTNIRNRTEYSKNF